MRWWTAFKPVVVIALVIAAGLLLTAGGLAAGLDWLLVPDPETAAAQFVSAMAAHRYTGALNQLSDDLRQQVKEEDLIAVMDAIEASPRGDILDAHEEEAQVQGGRATAAVRVQYQNLEETVLQFPMIKENGMWRLESIDPLK